MPVLPVLTALTTSLIALAFYVLPRKLFLERAHRHLKNHLSELARAWALLAGLYILRIPVLAGSQTDPPILLGGPVFVLAWHTLAILICAFTNLYLLRSIFDLEEGILLGPPASSRLQPFSLRSIFQSVTIHAILASLVLSLLVLYFSSIIPDDRLSTYVTSSYAPQLLVSMFLFLRLGILYHEYLKATALALTTFAYAIFQLGYLFFFLHLKQYHYEAVLTSAKLFFAIMVVWTMITRVSDLRFATHGQAQEPLQKLGKKLAKRARIQESAVAGVLLWLILALLLSAFYSVRAFYRLRSESGTPLHWTIFGCLLILLLLLGVLQYSAYIVLRKGRFRVRWRAHTDGALAELIHSCHEDTPFKGWRRIKLIGVEPVPATAHQNLSDQVRVILLHGLLSDGPRCWGLLPAIFLDSNRATEVSLLSFDHNLFTTRRRIDQLCDEVSQVLRGVLSESARPTVVFAHSLGGLLLLPFIRSLVGEQQSEVDRRLQHVCFVGSPFAGSWYAYLSFPWAWSRVLSIGSSYVREHVSSAFKVAIRPGLIIGEEHTTCTFSYIRGIRDRVVGGFVSLVDFPGHRFETAEAHSIPRVFSKDDGRMWSFIPPLNTLPRSVLAMRQVGGYLIGRREPKVECVFLFKGARSLDEAHWCADVGLRWGHTLPFSTQANIADEKPPLSEVLQNAYGVLGGSESEWEKSWKTLKAKFGRSYELREVVSQRWPGGHQLLLAANRYAGVAVVVSTSSSVQDLDQQEGLAQMKGSVLPIGQQMNETWGWNQSAGPAIFAERCEHRAALNDTFLETEAVVFNAAFDKDGNYLGIYERTGSILAPEGAEHVMVHTAGSGPEIEFERLKIRAFDLLLGEPLNIEWVAGGVYCHLWKINFRSPKRKGERFSLRWFFLWEHSMSVLGDMDAIDLSVLRPRLKYASLRLQTPAEPAIVSVGILSGGEVTRGAPSDQYIDKLTGQFHFEVAIPGQDNVSALILTYRLNREDRLLSFTEMVAVAKATQRDLDEVALLEKEIEGSAAAVLSALKKRRRHHPEGFVVAKLAGRVVAYVESHRWDVAEVGSFEQAREKAAEAGEVGPVCCLLFLGVVKTARRFGLGTRLLKEVEGQARESGVIKLQHVTFPEWVDFFVRRGFVVTRKIPKFFNGRDAVHLEKLLPQELGDVGEPDST